MGIAHKSHYLDHEAKPGKCAVPHCALDADGGGGSAACKIHTCRVVGCVATASILSTVFCDAHRCAEPGCTNPHAAAAISVIPTAAILNPHGGLVGGLNYCVEHSYRARMAMSGHHGHAHNHNHNHHHGPHGRNCQHGGIRFGGDGCGTVCCDCHGSDDDGDDDGCSDGTGSDRGGSVGIEIEGCICCGGCGGGGCGCGGKKHPPHPPHKPMKC